ncbi:MAG: NAD(P)H-hydrate dehydratase [Emcibacteraceae bacterium]|nr:NAD(P)H-hydrate dehydratase [Emcibacteraceae bacterium]MDG1727759.1 NAD(P)H-hydrate dehydratase [Emcibacteraceae bacterium]
MTNKYAILSTEQMKTADDFAIADLISRGHGGADLMEEAGRAVSRRIIGAVNGNSALVLCGSGNNGGDGFVIARHLKKAGFIVTLALLGDENNLTGDARLMADRWNGEIIPIAPDIVTNCDVIVDALFGTGLSKYISGNLEETLIQVNDCEALKVAVDIPSGIKGNSGEILGAAFKADITITFCRKKPAHLLYPGKEYCGETLVADIGIDDRAVLETKPDTYENHPDFWLGEFPILKSDGHKYHRGHAVVVSGDMISTGASRLAAMAAIKSGAGLVSVSSPDDALSTHAAHLTAIMIRKQSTLNNDLKDHRLNAWCIGPATGVNGNTRQAVLSIIRSGKKTVLDADALSVFEEGPLELFEAINKSSDCNCVLTPHSGEFGRVFPYLKKLDKLTATKNAAKLSGAIVIYKGADTVIASPDGRAVISSSAPPALATAGSGDVLAGIITGLLAQSMPAFEAACAAVWLHSECAKKIGLGLISEDLAKEIPAILQELNI